MVLAAKNLTRSFGRKRREDLDRVVATKKPWKELALQ